jgi:hypothetical protein
LKWGLSLLSSKKKPYFKTQMSWKEEKYGYGSQGGQKPRMTVGFEVLTAVVLGYNAV